MNHYVNLPITIYPFESQSQDKASLKYSALIRLFIFLLLELGYIALASICHHKPLLLPSSVSSSKINHFLTIIVIAWQTLAAIPVCNTILHVFSGEWSVQLSRTGRLVPGITDKVSTVTASLLDRLTYSLTGNPSWSFKNAFAASIALMALSGLAPGIFSTSNVHVQTPITLPIGNFTLTTKSFSLDGIMTFPIQRAELITRLEQIDKYRFGYDVQPNWIVGWPPIDLEGVNGVVEYPSDAVKYQYECTWEAPVVHRRQWGIQSWDTTRSSWGLWPIFGMSLDGFDSMLLPLVQFSGHNDINGRSAYLFLGTNTTFRTKWMQSSYSIDLSGIPATYNASGHVLGMYGNDPNPYAPPLASVLECDPQMKISTVTVVRDNNRTLHIRPLSSSEPIGNIPEAAANLLFSHSLLSATSTPEPYMDTMNFMNYISASLFTRHPEMNTGSTFIGNRPLNLSTINANLDAYISSASKAYAGGYYPADDSLPIGDFKTLPVPATVRVEKLALVTNKPLIIITIVLVGVIAILLGALILREEAEMHPFNLDSVTREVVRRCNVVEGQFVEGLGYKD